MSKTEYITDEVGEIVEKGRTDVQSALENAGIIGPAQRGYRKEDIIHKIRNSQYLRNYGDLRTIEQVIDFINREF